MFSPKKNILMPARKRRNRKQGKVPRGPDRLGHLTLSVQDTVNTVLSTTSNAGADVVTAVPIQIYTSTFSSKLNAFSVLFTRWRIKKLTVRFHSTLSTTTYGTFALGYLDDPEATAPTTALKVSQISGGRLFSPWVSQSSPFDLAAKGWLECYADGIATRFNSFGSLIFASTATSAAQFPGFLVFDAVVEFEGQNV